MRALRYVSALLVSIETTMSASTPAVMVCSFGTLPPTTRVSHRSRTNSYTPRITPMHWAAVPTLPEQMNALAARASSCGPWARYSTGTLTSSNHTSLFECPDMPACLLYTSDAADEEDSVDLS